MKNRFLNPINESNNLKDKLVFYSQQSLEDVLKKLQTDVTGLSDEEALKRLEQYGDNVITQEKPTPWYIHLIKSFINPFNIILLAIATVSLFTDIIFAHPEDRSYKTLIVISLMVTISGFLRFFQEYKSNKSAEKLKEMVRVTTTVLRRDSGKKEILMKDIVPGDIIYLSAGDMIPADMRLISSKDLFVSQSTLTGESEPVEKRTEAKIYPTSKINITELENICLLGTNVVSGTAIGVVVATGSNTYFGSVAQSIIGRRAITSFDKGVNSVSWLLIKFMAFMVPIVFFINGLTKGDWFEAILFALAIAVGLTPEMLPMVVTTNLAKGAVTMSKKKTIVKRLNSIQNFGAMDILCTDKTGTLTLDKVVLMKYLDVHGNEEKRVLRHAWLNSYYQTGLKNLLDVAILQKGREEGLEGIEHIYKKVDEIPFDFTRKRMSVVLENGAGKRQLVTKGAVEEMLSVCTLVEYQGEVIPLTESIKEEALKKVKELNKDGLRVIAVAQKNDVPNENIFSIADESNLVLMGFIGFFDPPKESAFPAIKALREYGVSVKILTGDNEIVTKKVCKDVGLTVDNIMLGHEIDMLSDEELAQRAENTTVFAKLTPYHKSRIIRALQQKGHTVGFLGDGINDAIALRDADVGISVDSAVDIAKESADIILLEKSLLVLEEGVVEGRKVFGNIIKYIKMTASSNFGNVFSVLTASAFLPFLPMLPVHLLVQNLCYDISQTSIPWDTMDEEYLKKPRQWIADDIARFMIWIGPISSIFDIVTYLVMWYVFKANSPEVQSLFQSGWFIEGLLSQTLIVHMIRTEKIPFIQSRASTPVMIMTSLIVFTGIIIPFSHFGASIGLQPLPPTYFIWLVLILGSYMLLTQTVKTIYIKRFKTWL
ncbi:MAG: magnesium-translocating P-type ATPase [Calditerrivibrio sp.]|nr:magnesium-translocating P-type ATPase [Calditerrivibrio sp.]